MGFLNKVVLPGNQIIHIDKYEVGLIESSYIEMSKSETCFTLKLDDFPDAEVTIHKAFDRAHNIEGYEISIVTSKESLHDLLREIYIYEDENDDIDLMSNNLMEMYLLHKFSSLDDNIEVNIEFYNCTLSIFIGTHGYGIIKIYISEEVPVE